MFPSELSLQFLGPLMASLLWQALIVQGWAQLKATERVE